MTSRRRLGGFPALLLALLTSACDPAASASALTQLPAVPGTDLLLSAGFDGERPLVVSSQRNGPSTLWRYDGTGWSTVLTAVSLGNVSTLPRGAALVVNRPAGGADHWFIVRVIEGVVSETPESPGTTVLGGLADGTLLVGDLQRVWRLGPQATSFELLSEEPALAKWDGVVLPDGRLLNRTPSGLALFGSTGSPLSTIACGELLCAKDSFGVGLVSGRPHMVFGSPLDTEYVITRVDLDTGVLARVGAVPAALSLRDTTFAAQVVQLAVTDRRWYAVRVEAYGSMTGWLMHNTLDGKGAPVVVTEKLRLGGALFTTPRAVWTYEPQQRRFGWLAR